MRRVLFMLVLSVGVATGADLSCGIKGRTPVTLRMDLGPSPRTLDAQRSVGTDSSEVVQNLYATLVQVTPDNRYIPDLAKSWEQSKDGLTWTFHLRRFVTTPSGQKEPLTWSDGTPFTSRDVLRGLRRLVDPRVGAPYSFFLNSVKNAQKISSSKGSEADKLMPTLGVETPDDHTVVFHLVSPTPYFLQLLAFSVTAPLAPRMPFKMKDGVPTRDLDLSGPFPTLAPYVLLQWNVNDSIILCRNPHYWKFRKGVPKGIPERVVFRSLGLGDVGFHAFERTYRNWENHDANANVLDGVDLTATVPTSYLKAMLANRGKPQGLFSTTYRPSMLFLAPAPQELYFYDFNNNKPPFKGNLKLRQALSLAMPREAITKSVLAAGQSVSYDYVPRGLGAFEPKASPWAALSYKEQVKKAQRLFREAGYSKEHPLDVPLWYNTSEGHKAIALTVASAYRKAFGEAIHVRLTNQEWKSFIETRIEGKEPGLYRDGWRPDFRDAATFADLYRTGNPNNNSHYSSKAYDALIKKAQKASDMAERLKLYTKAECLLKKDVPTIPIYGYVHAKMVAPYVKGYRPNFRATVQVEFLRIDKKNPRTKPFPSTEALFHKKAVSSSHRGVCSST